MGTAFEVTIDGSDLDDADRLLFSQPGITAAPKIEGPDEFSAQPRPVPNTFNVKIAADVPPGFYEARAVGYFGMSNPRIFQVTTLQEVKRDSGHTQRGNPQQVSVGSIVGGHVDDDAVDYYKFPVTAGQSVVVECFTRSIDSRMVAALVLYDAGGREVRRVRSGDGGDAVLEINAATDGEYVLGVHDFAYAASVDRFYRLAIHHGPHIDFIFPPVGEAGASGKFTLYGRNLPGGKPVENMSLDGSPLQRLQVDIELPGDTAARQRLQPAGAMQPFEATYDAFPWRWNGPQGASNAIAIGYASAPLVVEQEPNDDPAQPQRVSVPCEFAGQFYPRGDSDWVQFEANAGEVLSIEVLSHRLGLPTDPLLVIEQLTVNDQGETVANHVAAIDDANTSDKQPQVFSLSHRDPNYHFTASATGKYRVGVRDLYGESRGDPRMVYRLAIRKAQPDFQVFVFGGVATGQKENQRELGGLTLRRGAAETLQLHVQRHDGFTGAVEVVAEGLPPGVTCGGAILGGDVQQAPLILQADANASAAAGTFRVVGKATINGQDVLRQARHGAMIWGTEDIQKQLPDVRMTRDLALSVIDKETAPASIQAGDGKLIETCIGGVVQLPVKVSRHEGFEENVEPKVQGLPSGVQAKELKISGDDGVMEISFANNSITPGTYTFYLTDMVKKKNYTRNPDAVEKAEQRLKQLDELVKQLIDKAKQAAAAAKAAQEQANQKKDDPALADAAQQASEEARLIEENRKEAENRKKQAEEVLKNLRKTSEQKDIDWRLNSSPVSVLVAATPIAVAAQNSGNKKQGEKFQIPVSIQRKFGFEDAVALTWEAPAGVGGVNSQQVNVEKGQNQGVLEVALADNATAGSHTFTLRARVRFNNVQLDETLPVAFAIEPRQN